MTTFWQFLRRPVLVAMLAGAAFFGGLTYVSLEHPLAAGAVASGELVHLSNRLPVGHASGGRVVEVFVHDGQEVEAGEPLMELENPELERQLAVLRQRRAEFAVTVARFDALIEERDELALDVEAPAAIIARHQRLLRREADAQQRRLDLLNERIALKRAEIEGLSATEDVKTSELAEIEEQVKLFEELERRAAAPKMQVMEIRRQRHNIASELSEIHLQLQSARIAINDARLQYANEEADAFRRYERERSDNAAQLAEIEASLASLESRLANLVLRAPTDGTVIDLRFTGAGAVLEPNSEALALVPRGESFVIQARLAPTDVDKVAVGQTADITFTGLPSRYVSNLKATLTRIDAGRTDAEDGASYYRAWLELSPEAMSFALDHNGVVSGAPVEVRIKTDERTLASYIAEPLMGWWFRGLREV
ncbi:MAG: HlyD family type I secretion periplasmic adaptor subunit [Alphaproteobacteria bacterium]